MKLTASLLLFPVKYDPNLPISRKNLSDGIGVDDYAMIHLSGCLTLCAVLCFLMRVE